jgi:hypothetical protein
MSTNNDPIVIVSAARTPMAVSYTHLRAHETG